MPNTQQRKVKKTLKAKVIGLWGDPGISEYYNYDILSRFLIVQLEPFDECVTHIRKTQMIKLVLRPKELWISAQAGGGGKIRRDVWGNLNEQNISPPNDNSNNGLRKAEFLSQNIGPITPSYKIGDEITIVERDKELTPAQGNVDGINIFQSYDTRANSDQRMSDYHRGLEVNAYQYVIKHFLNNGVFYSQYFPAYHKNLSKLNKQYIIGNLSQQDALTNTGSDLKIKRRGGIMGGLNFRLVKFEDANVDRRRRMESSACVPIVVANPSTFPTPAQRNTGGINITL